MLDLERELQVIDPGVALPYWRFDRPAPNLFQLEFLGVSDSLGTVQFSNANPLQFWRTDGVQGINRRPLFNTGSAPPGLRSEAQTLALGTQYRLFRTMEGNPHGSAHTSFGGSISSIGTAAKDPLFFLLHCNVDRLWALWQRQNGRFDPALAASSGRSKPDRSQSPGLDVAVERGDRQSAAADRPWRCAGAASAGWCAGTAAGRTQPTGLPGCCQRCVADGVRLRRCRVLTRLARGDTCHGHETQSREEEVEAGPQA